jgi:hypothetical protein
MEPSRANCGRLARNKTNRKAVQSATIINGVCPQASKVLACPGLSRHGHFPWICPTNKTAQTWPAPPSFPVAPSFRRSTFLQK